MITQQIAGKAGLMKGFVAESGFSPTHLVYLEPMRVPFTRHIDAADAPMLQIFLIHKNALQCPCLVHAFSPSITQSRSSVDALCQKLTNMEGDVEVIDIQMIN